MLYLYYDTIFILHFAVYYWWNWWVYVRPQHTSAHHQSDLYCCTFTHDTAYSTRYKSQTQSLSALAAVAGASAARMLMRSHMFSFAILI